MKEIERHEERRERLHRPRASFRGHGGQPRAELPCGEADDERADQVIHPSRRGAEAATTATMRRKANSERGANGTIRLANRRNTGGSMTISASSATVLMPSCSAEVDCRAKNITISASSSEAMALDLVQRFSLDDSPKSSSESRMKPVDGVISASATREASRVARAKIQVAAVVRGRA